VRGVRANEVSELGDLLSRSHFMERRAYVCRKCHWRVFLDPDEALPTCPEHGKTMEHQENHPYRRSDGD
jgi:hypothetical protein